MFDADQRSSTGQVAIHAALLPESYRIILAGRNLPRFGPKSIPEPRLYGNVSTVYDVKTGNYLVTPNYETLFCTGHTVMSDGNVLAAGGDIGYISGSDSELSYPWMKEGRDVVRIFYKDSLKWETLPGVKLSEFRWYPTQVCMNGFAWNLSYVGMSSCQEVTALALAKQHPCLLSHTVDCGTNMLLASQECVACKFQNK